MFDAVEGYLQERRRSNERHLPGESAEYRAALSRTRQLPAPMEAGLLLLLLLLAGAGWAVTVGRMDGMDAGPGTDLEGWTGSSSAGR